VTVDARAFGESMAALAWHLDEPLSDGACIPLMHLARRAREEVVVVLSGEGADEVLAGYPVYAKMLTLERARALGGRALDRALGLAQAAPWWTPKQARWLRRARQPLPRAYLGVGRGFDDRLVEAFFGAAAMREVAERNAPWWARTAPLDPLHRMLYLDTKVWLPDDLLLKADKMTMAHSVELRVPFLDHELLAYAWSLPGRLKLSGGVGKRLLRTAMAGKLPPGIPHPREEGVPGAADALAARRAPRAVPLAPARLGGRRPRHLRRARAGSGCSTSTAPGSWTGARSCSRCGSSRSGTRRSWGAARGWGAAAPSRARRGVA
jgi:asparagine synthase (glutamine-hydrolysing)